MTAESPPIEIDGFRAAMREAGVEEIVESTLAIYLDEAPQAFARLEEAAKVRDAHASAAAAHALKSASSNIWATDLVDLLNPIETACLEGDTSQVAEALDALRPLFARVITYVKAQL
jgi:HPt (histidine-containing phosphotransfer) domain-containing protein